MRSKTDKRLLQSEKAIIEASIKTLLANPSASMSDIALAAGVGRATLYRHFESREVLIEKLILVCIEELEAVSMPVNQFAGRAAIEAAIEVTMPLADRFHFLATLWTDDIDSEAIRQVNNQLAQAMGDLIDQAKEAGEIDPALPTKWLVALHESTLMAAWWLIASGDLKIDDAVSYVKRSFFSGCRN
ncbi:MAG: TetR/AcrR family transcriptional regulator [Candidatus Promineifilaceae bacterium]